MTTRKFFLFFLILVALSPSANAQVRRRNWQPTHRQISSQINKTAGATQQVVTKEAKTTRQAVAQTDSNITAQLTEQSAQLATAQRTAEEYKQQLAVAEANNQKFQRFVSIAIYVAAFIAALVFSIIAGCFVTYLRFGKLPALYIKGFTQEVPTSGFRIHKVLSTGAKIGYIKEEERDRYGNADGFVVIHPSYRSYGIFIIPGRVERIAKFGLVPDHAAKGAWYAGSHGWEFRQHLLSVAA